MAGVSLGFVPQPLMVPIDKIMPSRKVAAGVAIARRFKRVRASIEEIGVIEPLTVVPIEGDSGRYMLLDGHVRLIILCEMGCTEVACLAATGDESYTYNNRINRISTIQEHSMLKRAVSRGVSPQRLAKALNVDLSQIIKKVNLLEGICPETVELLKDRNFSTELIRVLRKMKPARQVECVELMTSANNLTVTYAEALLVATPSVMLVDGKKPKRLAGLSSEQMHKMEREMANVQGQYRLVEQSYGQDVLSLVLARGYLVKLLANERVVRYLKQNQLEFLEQFSVIAASDSLDQ
jgi:hypothetical protein